MMTRDQIQTVLDALKYTTLYVPFSYEYEIKQSAAAIAILQAALAEPSEAVGEVVSQYSYQSVAWVEDCPEEGTKLFTHPAPSKQPTYGWLIAADEELVCTHLGVAELSDSYESAKAKLKTLIEWHVAVATDPEVNGGLSLQPSKPALLPELTDEEIMEIRHSQEWEWLPLVRAILAAAREK